MVLSVAGAEAGVRAELRRAVPLTFAGEALLAALVLGVEWLLASRLGPEGFGAFKTAAVSVPVLLLQAVYLNMESGILHLSVRRPAEAGSIVSSALAYALAGGGGVVLLGAALLPWWSRWAPGIPGWVLMLGLCQVPFLMAQTYLRSGLLAQGRYLPFNAILPLERVMVLGALSGIAAWLGWTAQGAVVAVLAGVAVTTLAAVLLFRRAPGAVGRASWPLFGELARFGAGFAFAQMAWIAMFSLNQLMVVRYAGVHEAGLYAFAMMGGQILLYLPKAVAPTYSRSVSGLEPEAVRAFTWRFVWRTLLALAAAAVLMLAVASRGVPLLLPEYADALPALMWFIPGILAVGALTYLFYHFRVESRLRLLNGAVFAGLVANLGVGWWSIPGRGACGAAQAFSCGTVLILLILMVPFLRGGSA